MPGPAYSVELIDHDGTPLGEIPQAQLNSVEWVCSGIGNIDFTIKQNNLRVSDIILHRHEARLLIDGWPRATEVPWQGPILDDDQDDQNVNFTGQSIEYYLTKRYMDFNSLYLDGSTLNGDGTVTPASVGFPGYDQLTIAWSLMQYAQGQATIGVTATNANKNMRITAPSFPTTINRLRQYLRENHQQIFELLSEFPGLVDYTTGVANGFDWNIICGIDGSRVWTPYYPQRGSVKADLTLEYGRNLLKFKVKESAVNFATRAICTGGSDGQSKLENEYNDAANSATYGEMMGVLSDGTQLDPTELGSKARAYVTARNHPVIDPSLEAVRVPVELLGQLQPGDTVPVSIHRGRTQIEANFRIKSVKWTPRPNVVILTFYPSLAGA
jgi:hypothetical protein